MALKELIKWSEKEHCSLPWRKKRTLYSTLVSEIMLQQTTVATVLKHFDRFMEQYPDINSLASTSEEELTIAWKGLGYYRRARNLLKAAKYIVEENDGRFPSDHEGLLGIPGVGDYTASALMSIGRNKPDLAIDANIERVVARLYGIVTPKGPKLMKEERALFERGELFEGWERYGSRSLNEALMDLGREYCQARKAGCLSCPMSDQCVSFKKNHVHKIPVVLEKAKKAQPHDLHLLRVICRGKKGLYAVRKKDSEWLAGQYELPTFVIETDDRNLKQYPHLKNKKIVKTGLLKFKTSITKYKITNSVIIMSEKGLKESFPDIKGEWLKGDVTKQNLSTASFKALERYPIGPEEV